MENDWYANTYFLYENVVRAKNSELEEISMVIAICDDNESDRKNCRKQLEQIAGMHNLDVEFMFYQNGEDMLFHIEDAKNQPNIIFLDMRMGGVSGDEIARQLRSRGVTSEIIFFTVSKEYYTSAFDVKALHYVVKGETSNEKLEDIFLQAVQAVQEKQSEYIICAGAGEFRNIEIKKIRYFQVMKRIITVHYNQSEEFSFYSTIGKIELRLQEYGFVKIHRSYLVSLFHIRTITFKEVVLNNGEVLPVGRSCYSDLKNRMEEYIDANDLSSPL